MVYAGLVLGTALVSGLFWYRYFYRRERALLDRLQKMIGQAEKGTLLREDISEEKVSLLENSLKRYLDGSQLVKESQQKQKDVIQGLISDISHQTLTPVSNLKIYAQLLAEEPAGDPEITDTILEQTEKLDFLIQSLVKLSRMENGIIAVHPKQTEVTELFGRLKTEYAKMAEEKQICLNVEPTDLKAEFDLKWTGEALGNILDNAVKYTGNGGSITVCAQEYSFFVRIDVADDGIGIEGEEIPKIFSRFYRSFSMADKPGVGIGLYLARQIVQAQKGYIKVSSAVGKGTVFSVYLPVSKKEEMYQNCGI